MNIKILPILFFLIILSSFIYADILYSQTSYDGTIFSAGNIIDGGYFKANQTVNIDRIEFPMYRQGSPGYCNVSLYNINQTTNITYGSKIDYGEFNANNLNTSLGGFVDVNYTNKFLVTNNVKYSAVIECPNGDGSNRVLFKQNETNSFPDAGRSYSIDGGTTWNTLATHDTAMVIYYTIPDNFTISAKNIYNDATIQTFSVEIDNYKNYSTTTGTITTEILTNESNTTRNIIVFATGYQTKTYSNYETTSNLEAQLNYNDSITPNIYVNFPDIEGFNNYSVNITLNCTDETAGNISYGYTFNGVDYFNATYLNKTRISKIVNITSGTNTFIGSCYDFINKNLSTIRKTFYSKEIILIEETTGEELDVTNLSIARVYNDNNNTLHDFKIDNSTKVNYTSTLQGKVRVVLGYYDIYGIASDLEVIRWFDFSLIEDEELRVCANKENIIHYEQIPYSSIEKEVVIKNIFADCYVSGEYTRFAYQDALALRVYTINTLYYLYTFNNESTSYLASIDGGISTTINIDNLEFNKEGYNINLYYESLDISEVENATDELSIKYQNIQDTITKSEITITNTKTGTNYVTLTETINPTSFSINWDYSAFSDEINETTVLTFTLTKYFNDGSESQLINYFTPTGGKGLLRPEIAAIIGFLTAIFGLTTTLPRITFSWFGIFVGLVGVGVCAFALTTWYVRFTMFVNIIVIMYCGILSYKQNFAQVA